MLGKQGIYKDYFQFWLKFTEMYNNSVHDSKTQKAVFTMRLDLSSLVMLVDILSNVGLWSLTQMIQSNPSHCETTTKTYKYELR